jgi:hypothetical protein
MRREAVERQALHPLALDTVRRRAHDSKLRMQAENKEGAERARALTFSRTRCLRARPHGLSALSGSREAGFSDGLIHVTPPPLVLCIPALCCASRSPSASDRFQTLVAPASLTLRGEGARKWGMGGPCGSWRELCLWLVSGCPAQTLCVLLACPARTRVRARGGEVTGSSSQVKAQTHGF